MRSGQIRESCGGCNNAGCRSFSFCGRPKAEFALRLFGQKGNAPSVLRLVSLPAVAFSMQIASLSGKIRNAPSVLRLASLGDLSRFAKQIAESPMREPQDFSPCLFARRAIGDPLGKTDSKQAVACWSVSVAAYRHCCCIFRTI